MSNVVSNVTVRPSIRISLRADCIYYLLLHVIVSLTIASKCCTGRLVTGQGADHIVALNFLYNVDKILDSKLMFRVFIFIFCKFAYLKYTNPIK